jgi:hypothetical protein
MDEMEDLVLKAFYELKYLVWVRDNDDVSFLVIVTYDIS